jgi:hypothetical protein
MTDATLAPGDAQRRGEEDYAHRVALSACSGGVQGAILDSPSQNVRGRVLGLVFFVGAGTGGAQGGMPVYVFWCRLHPGFAKSRSRIT